MNTEKDFTLEQIIEDSFDFSEYSPEEKTKTIAETIALVMETSLLKAIDDAGEEIQEKFNTFIETEPDEEQMTTFIGENLPKFGEVVIGEIKALQEMGKEE